MAVAKRIGIVANTSWSIYNFRLGLIRRLREEGYSVHLIAPQDSYSALLVAEGFRFHPIKMDRNGAYPLKDIHTFYQLYRIYKRNELDFIFHYTIKPNIYGSIAAAINNIPSIAITTGLGHLFSYSNPIVRWLTVQLYRFALLFSQQVWFLNQEDKEVFIQKRIVAEDKAFLLPSEGVNIKHFQPENYSFPEGRKITFLFAGRLLWDKGVGIFADAARIITQKYPNTRFELLGFVDVSNPNAISYDQIDDWQKEGILQYLGETEDVRPYLSQASCVLFPSFYGEGISRLLLESASMAKPIITTDNVGCREVVEHGVNGFLCQPRSTTDLIDKIELFLQLGEQQHRQMGLNGRKKMLREFDEDFIVNCYTLKLERIFETRTIVLPQKYLRKMIL